MIPDALHIGPIPIHVFGIMLALGFLAAGWALGREFERKGYDPQLASSALMWTALGSLVIARLWVVFESWDEFIADPLRFILTGGGFVFYGGLVGGAIAMTLFFRRHGIPWLRGADSCAPAIVLGQAIGRWGCQLAGDGDWGIETTGWWGMRYPHAVVGWDKPPGVYVHPTPIYESILYFAIFAFLWRIRRRRQPDGTVFYWYLVLSGTARFVVEFVRINPVTAFGLTEAQLTSIALVLLGMAGLVAQRRWRTAAA